jgi:ABC-type multidrug transport system fused ATPase/permease subunit
MLIRPLRQIADRFNNIQRGIVGAERVLGLMDEENSMPNTGTVKKIILPEKLNFRKYILPMMKSRKY